MHSIVFYPNCKNRYEIKLENSLRYIVGVELIVIEQDTVTDVLNLSSMKNDSKRKWSIAYI